LIAAITAVKDGQTPHCLGRKHGGGSTNFKGKKGAPKRVEKTFEMLGCFGGSRENPRIEAPRRTVLIRMALTRSQKAVCGKNGTYLGRENQGRGIQH